MRYLILLLFLFSTKADAQSCNPASVYYIGRDEKGKVLSPTDLKIIYQQLPKKIGDANTSDGEVSFLPDKLTYYWPEDADWEKGTKLPALLFANAATCTMQLGEVTLTYQGKTMRLLFNIDINRTQDDRRQVVDSLRFQNGTFRLDLTSWQHSRDTIIPPTLWERVKNAP